MYGPPPEYTLLANLLIPYMVCCNGGIVGCRVSHLMPENGRRMWEGEEKGEKTRREERE